MQIWIKVNRNKEKKGLHLFTLIVVWSFNKFAFVLTYKDLQMFGNNWLPTTISKTENRFKVTVLIF